MGCRPGRPVVQDRPAAADKRLHGHPQGPAPAPHGRLAGFTDHRHLERRLTGGDPGDGVQDVDG